MTETKNIPLKKKRVMIYFIEATENLMKEVGINGLSIRKIADAAGYNSATLYNYFENLEHLILFASIRYLKDYIVDLSHRQKPDMTSLELYHVIYECFNHYAFREPEIFHNMFFGKYSNTMEELLHIYYNELFPSELEGLNDTVKSMLLSSTPMARDRWVMKEMIKDGYVSEEKADFILETIVRVHESYIYDAYKSGDNLDLEEHTKNFNRLFDFILSNAK